MVKEEEMREATGGKEAQVETADLGPVHFHNPPVGKLSSDIEIKSDAKILDSTEGIVKTPEDEVLVEAPSEVTIPTEHNLNSTASALNEGTSEEEKLSHEQLQENNQEDEDLVEALPEERTLPATDESSNMDEEATIDSLSHREGLSEDASLLECENEELKEDDQHNLEGDVMDNNLVQEEIPKSGNAVEQTFGTQQTQNPESAEAIKDTQPVGIENIPGDKVLAEAAAEVQIPSEHNMDDSDTLPDTTDENTKINEQATADDADHLGHEENLPEDTDISEYRDEVARVEAQQNVQADVMDADTVQEEIPKSEHDSESTIDIHQVQNPETEEIKDTEAVKIEETSHQSNADTSEKAAPEDNVITSVPTFDIQQVQNLESAEEIKGIEAVETEEASQQGNVATLKEPAPEDNVTASEPSIDTQQVQNLESEEEFKDIQAVKSEETSRQSKVATLEEAVPEVNVTAREPTCDIQQVQNVEPAEEIKDIEDLKTEEITQQNNIANSEKAAQENNIPASEPTSDVEQVQKLELAEVKDIEAVKTEENSIQSNVATPEEPAPEDSVTASESIVDIEQTQELESAEEIKDIEVVGTEETSHLSHVATFEEPAPGSNITESEPHVDIQQIQDLETAEEIKEVEAIETEQTTRQSKVASFGEPTPEDNVTASERLVDIQQGQELEPAEEIKDTEAVETEETSHPSHVATFEEPAPENDITASEPNFDIQQVQNLESAELKDTEAIKSEETTDETSVTTFTEPAIEDNVTASEPTADIQQVENLQSSEEIKDIGAVETEETSNKSNVATFEEAAPENNVISREQTFDIPLVQNVDSAQEITNTEDVKAEDTSRQSSVSTFEETAPKNNVIATENASAEEHNHPVETNTENLGKDIDNSKLKQGKDIDKIQESTEEKEEQVKAADLGSVHVPNLPEEEVPENVGKISSDLEIKRDDKTFDYSNQGTIETPEISVLAEATSEVRTPSELKFDDIGSDLHEEKISHEQLQKNGEKNEELAVVLPDEKTLPATDESGKTDEKVIVDIADSLSHKEDTSTEDTGLSTHENEKLKEEDQQTVERNVMSDNIVGEEIPKSESDVEPTFDPQQLQILESEDAIQDYQAEKTEDSFHESNFVPLEEKDLHEDEVNKCSEKSSVLESNEENPQDEVEMKTNSDKEHITELSLNEETQDAMLSDLDKQDEDKAEKSEEPFDGPSSENIIEGPSTDVQQVKEEEITSAQPTENEEGIMQEPEEVLKENGSPAVDKTTYMEPEYKQIPTLAVTEEISKEEEEIECDETVMVEEKIVEGHTEVASSSPTEIVCQATDTTAKAESADLEEKEQPEDEHMDITASKNIDVQNDQKVDGMVVLKSECTVPEEREIAENGVLVTLVHSTEISMEDIKESTEATDIATEEEIGGPEETEHDRKNNETSSNMQLHNEIEPLNEEAVNTERTETSKTVEAAGQFHAGAVDQTEEEQRTTENDISHEEGSCKKEQQSNMEDMPERDFIGQELEIKETTESFPFEGQIDVVESSEVAVVVGHENAGMDETMHEVINERLLEEPPNIQLKTDEEITDKEGLPKKIEGVSEDATLGIPNENMHGDQNTTATDLGENTSIASHKVEDSTEKDGEHLPAQNSGEDTLEASSDTDQIKQEPEAEIVEHTLNQVSGDLVEGKETHVQDKNTTEECFHTESSAAETAQALEDTARTAKEIGEKDYTKESDAQAIDQDIEEHLVLQKQSCERSVDFLALGQPDETVQRVHLDQQQKKDEKVEKQKEELPTDEEKPSDKRLDIITEPVAEIQSTETKATNFRNPEEDDETKTKIIGLNHAAETALTKGNEGEENITGTINNGPEGLSSSCKQEIFQESREEKKEDGNQANFTKNREFPENDRTETPMVKNMDIQKSIGDISDINVLVMTVTQDTIQRKDEEDSNFICEGEISQTEIAAGKEEIVKCKENRDAETSTIASFVNKESDTITKDEDAQTEKNLGDNMLNNMEKSQSDAQALEGGLQPSSKVSIQSLIAGQGDTIGETKPGSRFETSVLQNISGVGPEEMTVSEMIKNEEITHIPQKSSPSMTNETVDIITETTCEKEVIEDDNQPKDTGSLVADAERSNEDEWENIQKDIAPENASSDQNDEAADVTHGITNEELETDLISSTERDLKVLSDPAPPNDQKLDNEVEPDLISSTKQDLKVLSDPAPPNDQKLENEICIVVAQNEEAEGLYGEEKECTSKINDDLPAIQASAEEVINEEEEKQEMHSDHHGETNEDKSVEKVIDCDTFENKPKEREASQMQSKEQSQEVTNIIEVNENSAKDDPITSPGETIDEETMSIQPKGLEEGGENKGFNLVAEEVDSQNNKEDTQISGIASDECIAEPSNQNIVEPDLSIQQEVENVKLASTENIDAKIEDQQIVERNVMSDNIVGEEIPKSESDVEPTFDPQQLQILKSEDAIQDYQAEKTEDSFHESNYVPLEEKDFHEDEVNKCSEKSSVLESNEENPQDEVEMKTNSDKEHITELSLKKETQDAMLSDLDKQDEDKAEKSEEPFDGPSSENIIEGPSTDVQQQVNEEEITSAQPTENEEGIMQEPKEVLKENGSPAVDKTTYTEPEYKQIPTLAVTEEISKEEEEIECDETVIVEEKIVEGHTEVASSSPTEIVYQATDTIAKAESADLEEKEQPEDEHMDITASKNIDVQNDQKVDGMVVLKSECTVPEEREIAENGVLVTLVHSTEISMEDIKESTEATNIATEEEIGGPEEKEHDRKNNETSSNMQLHNEIEPLNEEAVNTEPTETSETVEAAGQFHAGAVDQTEEEQRTTENDISHEEGSCKKEQQSNMEDMPERDFVGQELETKETTESFPFEGQIDIVESSEVAVVVGHENAGMDETMHELINERLLEEPPNIQLKPDEEITDKEGLPKKIEGVSEDATLGIPNENMHGDQNATATDLGENTSIASHKGEDSIEKDGEHLPAQNSREDTLEASSDIDQIKKEPEAEIVEHTLNQVSGDLVEGKETDDQDKNTTEEWFHTASSAAETAQALEDTARTAKEIGEIDYTKESDAQAIDQDIEEDVVLQTQNCERSVDFLALGQPDETVQRLHLDQQQKKDKKVKKQKEELPTDEEKPNDKRLDIITEPVAEVQSTETEATNFKNLEEDDEIKTKIIGLNDAAETALTKGNKGEETIEKIAGTINNEPEGLSSSCKQEIFQESRVEKNEDGSEANFTKNREFPENDSTETPMVKNMDIQKSIGDISDTNELVMTDTQDTIQRKGEEDSNFICEGEIGQTEIAAGKEEIVICKENRDAETSTIASFVNKESDTITKDEDAQTEKNLGDNMLNNMEKSQSDAQALEGGLQPSSQVSNQSLIAGQGDTIGETKPGSSFETGVLQNTSGVGPKEMTVSEMLKNEEITHIPQESSPSMTIKTVDIITETYEKEVTEDDNQPKDAGSLVADAERSNEDEWENIQKDTAPENASSDQNDEAADVTHGITNEELEIDLISSTERDLKVLSDPAPPNDQKLDNEVEPELVSSIEQDLKALSDPAPPHDQKLDNEIGTVVAQNEEAEALHGEEKVCTSKINDDLLAIQASAEEVTDEVEEKQEMHSDHHGETNEDKSVEKVTDCDTFENKPKEREASQMQSKEQSQEVINIIEVNENSAKDDPITSPGETIDEETMSIQPRGLEEVQENKGFDLVPEEVDPQNNKEDTQISGIASDECVAEPSNQNIVEPELSIQQEVENVKLASTENIDAKVEIKQQKVDPSNDETTHDYVLSISKSSIEHEMEAASAVTLEDKNHCIMNNSQTNDETLSVEYQERCSEPTEMEKIEPEKNESPSSERVFNNESSEESKVPEEGRTKEKLQEEQHKEATKLSAETGDNDPTIMDELDNQKKQELAIEADIEQKEIKNEKQEDGTDIISTEKVLEEGHDECSKPSSHEEGIPTGGTDSQTDDVPGDDFVLVDAEELRKEAQLCDNAMQEIDATRESSHKGIKEHEDNKDKSSDHPDEPNQICDATEGINTQISEISDLAASDEGRIMKHLNDLPEASHMTEAANNVAGPEAESKGEGVEQETLQENEEKIESTTQKGEEEQEKNDMLSANMSGNTDDVTQLEEPAYKAFDKLGEADSSERMESRDEAVIGAVKVSSANDSKPDVSIKTSDFEGKSKESETNKYEKHDAKLNEDFYDKASGTDAASAEQNIMPYEGTTRNLDVSSIVTASDGESTKKATEDPDKVSIVLPEEPTEEETKTSEKHDDLISKETVGSEHQTESELSLSDNPLPAEPAVQVEEEMQIPGEPGEPEEARHESDLDNLENEDHKDVEQSDLPVSRFLMNLILREESGDPSGNTEIESQSKQEETVEDDNHLTISKQEENQVPYPTEQTVADKLIPEGEKQDVKSSEEINDLREEQSIDSKMDTEKSLEHYEVIQQNITCESETSACEDKVQGKTSGEVVSLEEAGPVTKVETREFDNSDLQLNNKVGDTTGQENIEATVQTFNGSMNNNLDILTDREASEEDTLEEGRKERTGYLHDSSQDEKNTKLTSEEQTLPVTEPASGSEKDLPHDNETTQSILCPKEEESLDSSNNDTDTLEDALEIQSEIAEVENKEENQDKATEEATDSQLGHPQDSSQKGTSSDAISEQTLEVTEPVGGSKKDMAHDKEAAGSFIFMKERECSDPSNNETSNFEKALQTRSEGLNIESNEGKQDEAADSQIMIEKNNLPEEPGESDLQKLQETDIAHESNKETVKGDQQISTLREPVTKEENKDKTSESHAQILKNNSSEEPEVSDSQVQGRDLEVESPVVEESFVEVTKPEGSTNEEQSPKAYQEKIAEEKIDDEKNEREEETKNFGTDATVTTEAREAGQKLAHKKHNILSGVGSKVKHQLAKVKKAIIGKPAHSKSELSK